MIFFSILFQGQTVFASSCVIRKRGQAHFSFLSVVFCVALHRYAEQLSRSTQQLSLQSPSFSQPCPRFKFMGRNSARRRGSKSSQQQPVTGHSIKISFFSPREPVGEFSSPLSRIFP
ncbi:hypothetical protein AVEN_78541-1 [Araneus ventricosus]|uniref:Uncharacterized protein n=1 Tax=Araneus ventricosus TaxID=182803 RepID=A0A4Y1ZQ35_ARAVE|nr:hypothetical protein AVEN_78541-1 [Araneus ventricosus]